MSTTSASVPAPETDRVTVLTDKGTAVRFAYKLAAALRALDAEAREDAMSTLYQELAELPA